MCRKGKLRTQMKCIHGFCAFFGGRLVASNRYGAQRFKLHLCYSTDKIKHSVASHQFFDNLFVPFVSLSFNSVGEWTEFVVLFFSVLNFSNFRSYSLQRGVSICNGGAKGSLRVCMAKAFIGIQPQVFAQLFMNGRQGLPGHGRERGCLDGCIASNACRMFPSLCEGARFGVPLFGRCVVAFFRFTGAAGHAGVSVAPDCRVGQTFHPSDLCFSGKGFRRFRCFVFHVFSTPHTSVYIILFYFFFLIVIYIEECMMSMIGCGKCW